MNLSETQKQVLVDVGIRQLEQQFSDAVMAGDDLAAEAVWAQMHRSTSTDPDQYVERIQPDA